MSHSASLINDEPFVECFTFYETLGKIYHLINHQFPINRLEIIEVNPKYYAVPFPDPVTPEGRVVPLRDLFIGLASYSANATLAAISSTIDDSIPSSGAWEFWDPTAFLSKVGLRTATKDLGQSVLNEWSYGRGRPQGVSAWMYAYLASWLKGVPGQDIEPEILALKRRIDSMERHEFNRFHENEKGLFIDIINRTDLPNEIDEARINSLYLEMSSF